MRFDIAMNDAYCVSCCQGFRKLTSNRECLIGRERLTCDDGGEGFAFDILHGNVTMPIMLADFMNGTDVRMIKSGCGARFPQEMALGVAIGCLRLGEKLDRNLSVQQLVYGQVYFPHTARAESFNQKELGDFRAYHLAFQEESKSKKIYGRLHWRARKARYERLGDSGEEYHKYLEVTFWRATHRPRLVDWKCRRRSGST